MLNKRVHEKYEKLLDKLYSKCNYTEFIEAVEIALRAYQRISKNDSVFNHSISYFGVIGCEDKLISIVFEYYLAGNGKKENLNEDIFSMINVLSRNREDILASELKQLFLNIYETH